MQPIQKGGLVFFLPLATSILFLSGTPETGKAEVSAFDYLKAVNAPQNLVPATASPLLIAIIDDGIRVSHPDLQELIWKNPAEIPDNSLDDDGNGKTDDIHGWDIADNDPEVMPSGPRLADLYHGTHLAGIVAAILRRAYADQTKDLVSILPVKILSDHTESTRILSGYQGIEYAIETGADVILCAWNSSHISEKEERILRRAEEQDILIIGSAGNFTGENRQYPAAFDSVISVTALNREKDKMKHANLGPSVDISAPGIQIMSSGSLSDTDRQVHEGTSQAAAMVAAAAVLVKIQHPEYSREEITATLKNSADPLQPKNPQHIAKLGAGSLNISKAAAGISKYNPDSQPNNRPQGYLYYPCNNDSNTSWQLEIPGKIKGILFKKPFTSDVLNPGTLSFFQGESDSNHPFISHSLATMPAKIFIPGNKATIRFEPGSMPGNPSWLMDYRAETIDFHTLYCQGTRYLTEEGVFSDGSGVEEYAANSDCKWQITAPPGQIVRIKFTAFATEAKKDFIYFFNGTGTHEKIMAIYSGPVIPPELTSWGNKVLVWFVSNSTKQAQGWQAEYSFEKNTIENTGGRTE